MSLMARVATRISRRWLLIAACALLCAFEVTTRLLPPDGMTETINSDGLQSTVRAGNFIELRDTAAIEHVYAALNNGALRLGGGPSCNINGPVALVTTEITFTWHGLPTQVWSQQNCSYWSRTSGGLPDLWSRVPTAALGV
ncbi:MAG TPA: hypothetical protein VF812_00430 [Ktedonobacterales bacterium]